MFNEREKEIYEFIKNGVSRRRIAELLHISEHTVKAYEINILRKLSENSDVKRL